MNKTGFGFLRLPRLNAEDETSIDFSVTEQMVDRYLQLGGTYFDTAYTYLGGASEQGMSQWASAFAEQALQIPKAVGDLAGPLSFALCMGLARAGYAKFSEKMDLEKFMMGSAALCVAAYLITCLSPSPLLSFLGCALGGFSVGIMWPGTFSLGVAGIRNGGTVMAAFFAVAGDVGCSLGPTLVGIASDALDGDLKRGMLSAIVFPVALLLAVITKRTNTRKQ